MAAGYEEAVRAGVMSAARLHQELGLKEKLSSHGGSVDVFEAIQNIDLPLLLRPLDGLLGAYINDPSPGILVTTRRPMSIQRFTAAHELGHYQLDHQPSLDDEDVLRRMSLTRALPKDNGFQEVEADAFAVAFMLPKWLILWHMKNQGWGVKDLLDPIRIYQLSLRLGASYKAMCWTLLRHKLITRAIATDLANNTQPRTLKEALLSSYEPQSYHGNVWLLTERDANTRIDGSHNDLFVLRLAEHSNGGYLWDIDQLKASGFGIVNDEREEDALWSGYYFERMTCCRTGSGETLNPLWDIVERIKDPEVTSLKKFELSLFDSARDVDRSPYGGQCLSHLSFKVTLGEQKQLRLTALYRNHYYIEKLLGNLVGSFVYIDNK